ncbi:MAG: MotA/TolQ/ExbB proton channel family protein [Puniceicoccales bacterium]|jgi:biopolymer transport protein ExbB|nr:MotA/TolQ/ExbB proton channel family protein [Puniceicoccales bacterium]
MQTVEDFSVFRAAGPFLVPLLLLSVVALVFFLERFYFLHRRQIRTGEFLSGLGNLLARGRHIEALTVCEEAPGPVPRVVKAVLQQRDSGREAMRAAAEGVAILEVPALERRVGAIGVIAGIAPLTGLAGTVFALCRAFFRMRSQGHYATADAFSADIAAALASTAIALVLAILASLGHHFLVARVHAIANEIEWAAHDAMEFCSAPPPAAGEAPPAARR